MKNYANREDNLPAVEIFQITAKFLIVLAGFYFIISEIIEAFGLFQKDSEYFSQFSLEHPGPLFSVVLRWILTFFVVPLLYIFKFIERFKIGKPGLFERELIDTKVFYYSVGFILVILAIMNYFS